MAAKPTPTKAAPSKTKAKTAAKPAKTAKAVTKPAAKPAAKKPAAGAKKAPAAKPAAAKAVVAKKPAPAKVVEKKAAPVKAAEPAKKPAPKAPVAQPKASKPAAKAPAPKAGVPAAKPAVPAVKAISPIKAAAPVKPSPAPAARKSSLIDVPPPPPPVKPPFVPPPKPVVELQAEAPAASGANGSHSPGFVQKQKQRLLDLRDELVDSMSGMTRDTIRNAPEGSEASGSGQHQGDAGSDAYDRDFALSVLAKEQDALYEIEQALRRIQAGTYGICEISSKKIPQARLEAIPFARLTVECQAQWEKEYGKRRFRPSNEVGFSGGNYIEDDESETVSLDEDED